MNRHPENLIRSITRLLGVMFAIEGIAGIIGYGLELMEHWRVSNEYSSAFAGGYAIAWLLSSVFLLAAGLTLVFRTHIALDAIFHDADEPDEANGVENDANASTGKTDDPSV